MFHRFPSEISFAPIRLAVRRAGAVCSELWLAVEDYCRRSSCPVWVVQLTFCRIFDPVEGSPRRVAAWGGRRGMVSFRWVRGEGGNSAKRCAAGRSTSHLDAVRLCQLLHGVDARCDAGSFSKPRSFVGQGPTWNRRRAGRSPGPDLRHGAAGDGVLLLEWLTRALPQGRLQVRASRPCPSSKARSGRMLEAVTPNRLDSSRAEMSETLTRSV